MIYFLLGLIIGLFLAYFIWKYVTTTSPLHMFITGCSQQTVRRFDPKR